MLTKHFLNNLEENLKKTYCVTDIETTGQKPEDSEIIEIASLKVQNGQIIDEFCSYVKPTVPIPDFITQMTGIKNEDVLLALPVKDVLEKWLNFFKGSDYFCAHNVMFDFDFIYKNFQFCNLPLEELNKARFFCTVKVARYLYPNLKSRKLGDLIKHFNISVNNRHRALDDATATAQLLIMFFNQLKARKNELLIEIEKLQNDYLKSFEAAEYLSVPKEQIYEMVKSGRLQVSETYTTKGGYEGYLFLRRYLENMLLNT